MNGRPPKTLYQHVRDGTFRPSRHADLLATDWLPPELANLGKRYRAAASARERQAVALDFRDAIAHLSTDHLPPRAEAPVGPETIDEEALDRRFDAWLDNHREEVEPLLGATIVVRRSRR